MGGRRFIPKTEQELAQLSEDKLMAYVLDARRAGDREAANLAVSILVYKLMPMVRRRVAGKIPPASVDEVADAVLLSAITSDYDESTVGQFRSWLSTIIARRIADFHRNPKSDIRLERLPTEHQGDDEIWGDEPESIFAGDTIDAQNALERAYNELSEKHQEVIDLYIFADLSGGDVAARTGMSEDNVHQIARRFRKRFDEALDPDDDTPG